MLIFVNFKKSVKILFFCLFVIVTLLSAINFSNSKISKSFAQTEPSYPTTPPAQICGKSEILDGPSEKPSDAVEVPAGDNLEFFQNEKYSNATGKTYWFAPGVHTLGDSEFGQIEARPDSTYIGAPGAILDGQKINRYAFTQRATGVTIKHLTIRNFGTPPVGSSGGNNNEGVVNHDAGDNWTIASNTIKGNQGAGVFLGSNNVVKDNCLDSNGQYGFSMFKPQVEGDAAIKNVIIDHNEISNNNTEDWESKIHGCGCTGGGKFWDVKGARVTRNWVHHNKSVALWADTNNIDFLFEGNYIDQNDSEGIFYEVSYNATIRNNYFRNNAWVKGAADQGSPAAAIYLSESGGDDRASFETAGEAKVSIYNNKFENNFSGVSIYENSNRFCNSNGNTSKAYCTPFQSPVIIPQPHNYTYPDPINDTHPCYTDISSEPYSKNCRWRSQNIEVRNNEFHFDKVVVPCAGTFCGVQALYASGNDNVSWSPYTISKVQSDVMFNQNNKFYDNQYFGEWRFAKGFGEKINFSVWQSSPYNQDAGSTCEGCVSSVLDNHLDKDTSSLENSIGKWSAWFSSSVSQSTEQAHKGLSSLKVEITNSYGWGVQLSNWPGFSAAAGNKRISFWGKLGSGNQIGTTMRVKWRDSNNADIQTDILNIPTLTNDWEYVSVDVEAPIGTSSVHVEIYNSAGDSGDVIYLDDLYVGDRPLPDTQAPTTPANLNANLVSYDNVELKWDASTDNVDIIGYKVYRDGVEVGKTKTTNYKDTTVSHGTAYLYSVRAYDAANNISDFSNGLEVKTPSLGNHLNADSSTLEASLGKWSSWFSSEISHSSEDAQSGANSMKVNITARNGWGVQLSNWPGFSATSGDKKISFWGRLGAGKNLNATMKVKWRNSLNFDLQVDTLNLPLVSSEWREATADVVAPIGTTSVHVELVDSSGKENDYIFIDDIYVGDRL